MKATKMISDCTERFVKRCKGGEHCVRTTEGRGIYFRRGGEKAGSTLIPNSWNVKEGRSIFSGFLPIFHCEMCALIIVPTADVADR